MEVLMKANTGKRIGVLDLGSNTFNIKFVTFENNEINSIFKYKKYVDIISSTSKNGIVNRNKREDFYHTFKEFKTIIDSQKPDIFKVIATNSFRNLKDIDFVKTIENILNHEIDIISPDQESKYVFKGVLSTNKISDDKFFILDIGGSSTEIIKVEDNKMIDLKSLQLGSVSLTNKFTKNNKFIHNDSKNYISELITKQAVSDLSFKNKKHLYGTSGSFKTAYRSCQILAGADKVNFKETISKITKAKELSLNKNELKDYIDSSRIKVLPACLLILNAILDALNVGNVYKSNSGLREGVLHELYQKTI